MILVKKYPIVRRTAQCRVFCCRVHLRPPRSCSFHHRPETIELIIAAMTNINAQSAASAYQRNSRIGAETDKSGEERKILATSGNVRRLFRHLDHRPSVQALKPTVAVTRSAGESDIFAHVRPEKGVARALIELLGMDDEEFDDR